MTSRRPLAFPLPLAYTTAMSKSMSPIVAFAMSLDHFLSIPLLKMETNHELKCTKIDKQTICLRNAKYEECLTNRINTIEVHNSLGCEGLHEA